MWSRSKGVGTTGSTTVPVDILVAKMRGVVYAKQGILLRINHSFSNITDKEKVSKGDERGS